MPQAREGDSGEDRDRIRKGGAAKTDRKRQGGQRECAATLRDEVGWGLG